jgi:predicted type IV restriction endonuclease
MAKVPKKVADRLNKTVATFQRVLADANKRDVNEADTVTIVTDLLSDVFGYDKFRDITREQAIKGTFCDLAVKQDGKVKFLIEVKAIGLTLKENHLRQAVNYGANQGIPWVVLTNGLRWELYCINFEKPISHEEVCTFEFLELSPRKKETHDILYLLCKEGLSRDAIEAFHEHVQVVNRFVLGALITSDPVLNVVRREMKRIDPDLRATIEELRQLLPAVLKRDLLEGDAADQAKRRIAKASSKPLRKRKAKRSTTGSSSEAPSAAEVIGQS